MSESYERLKRSRELGYVRSRAAEEGIALRTTGAGWAAMVGTKDDGSVWIWDEVTKVIRMIEPAGTVRLNELPDEPKRRGRPNGPAPVPMVRAKVGFEALLD